MEGVALSDVARIPGFGLGECILGDALGEMRESAFLATKLYPGEPAVPVPEQRAIASANRLGIRCLDLYQVHQPGRITPRSSIMRGIRALQEAGMVSEVGVSNASLERWRTAERALGRPVLSNQVGYSLVTRSAEHDLLPFAESHGRVVIAYRPLELGLLAGLSSRQPSGEPDPGRLPTLHAAEPRTRPRTDRTLREVADAHAASLAQVALAWVIRHPAVAAIPGASSVEQLECNVAATEIDLAEDEYGALQLASSRFRPDHGPGFMSRQIKSLGGPGRRVGADVSADPSG